MRPFGSIFDYAFSYRDKLRLLWNEEGISPGGYFDSPKVYIWYLATDACLNIEICYIYGIFLLGYVLVKSYNQ